MATCANCIHHSLCDYNTNISGDGKVRLVYAEGADVKCSFFQNTSDVVPKSEVDAQLDDLTAECKACGERTSKVIEDLQKKLAEAKAEVARDIFAEIEMHIIENCCVTDDDVDGIWKHIAELKKKYIPQDCRTCRHMLSCEPNVFGICEEYEEEDKNGKENT